MNNQKISFLPIGSVVLLKGGVKRVMITGFCCIDGNKKDRVFDYVGCLYPEGIKDSRRNFLFNNSDIAKVYYLGYSDNEEKEFKKKLNDRILKVIALTSKNK